MRTDACNIAHDISVTIIWGLQASILSFERRFIAQRNEVSQYTISSTRQRSVRKSLTVTAFPIPHSSKLSGTIEKIYTFLFVWTLRRTTPAVASMWRTSACHPRRTWSAECRITFRGIALISCKENIFRHLNSHLNIGANTQGWGGERISQITYFCKRIIPCCQISFAFKF